MANVRAPNRNFALGVPASTIPMSRPVNPVASIPIPVSAYNPIATPQCSVLCAGGGGGGSSNGAGYATT